MTLEALHTYHPVTKYLVIDNAPTSSSQTKGVTNAVGGRYLHRPDLVGTSPPRDALFRLADTDWVMCIDSHVLLEQGAVQCLLDYIEENPDSNDLISGPMIYDDGKSVSTHWRQDAPPGLWGTWDTDPRGVIQFGSTVCHLGAIGDGKTHRERSIISHQLDHGNAFEIPMQGLGLFAMRKAAWPGFHPLFRGFGGEEGYIHEKVRQRGGKCLCLPVLRWRHRFRHMEHGAPPPPYPLSLEDHTRNLLLGHRELGIKALPEIEKTFGNRLPQGVFAKLVEESEKLQEFGKPADKKRLKLAAIWYSNNAAPVSLLQKSLSSIKQAQIQTMHHDVVVTTCAWEPILNNPFLFAINHPAVTGHAAIISQIRTCLDMVVAKLFNYDGICFLENDVLYPPNYFDKVGDALTTGAPVVSNLDYEGLNATGWLRVRERHEPLHQLSMRKDIALTNLERAEADCKRDGWALLEPQGDRNDWVRLAPVGLAPSIHVNW